MATQEEKQAYIDEMVRKRGYVLDYHKVMTHYDFDVLQAANGLVEAAYLKERRLDRKTKELIFIVSLTVMRASKGHIQSHIRVALDLGLSKEGDPGGHRDPAARGWGRGLPGGLRSLAGGYRGGGDRTEHAGPPGRLRVEVASPEHPVPEGASTSGTD